MNIPEIILTAAFFWTGAVIGSFLDCMAWRMVHAEAAGKTRSVCDKCGRTLHFADLIPVVSYLIFRGRCRYCGERISIRHPVCEILTGLVFSLGYAFLGPGPAFVKLLALCVLILPPALIDIETKTVPNVFFVLLALVRAAILPFEEDRVRIMIDAALGGVGIPLCLLAISLIMKKAVGRDCLGLGDIKLLFAIGLYLGFYRSLLNVVLMSLLGLATAFLRRDKTDRAFAFVPAIGLSTVICQVCGGVLIKTYFGLFGLEAVIV